MKTSKTNLIAILTIAAVALAASTASAHGKKSGGSKGGFKVGGFKIGGGHKHHSHHKHHGHHGHHHHKHFHHKPYYSYPVKYIAPIAVYDQSYQPYYSYCFVNPDDTWYTISQRCYGYGHLGSQVARYNGLSQNSPLLPGQQLRLPVVNSDGTLTRSNAPAPSSAAQGGQSGFAPQTQTTPQTNPAQFNNGPRPTVAIGSALVVDGQAFGDKQGIVRLRINGMALPVEVLEWNAGSVKIQLPKMELGGATSAELELLRADGSLASNSPIELTPATTRLALGN